MTIAYSLDEQTASLAPVIDARNPGLTRIIYNSAVVRRTIRLHVAVLAALPAISAAVVPARAPQPRQRTMQQPGVTAHLSVDASPHELIARVTVENTSAATVLIEPYNAVATLPLEADVFHIVRDGDNAVRYTGMMVKRGRLREPEYVRLEPGKPLRASPVDLTSAYDFPTGTHRYTAQYVARVTYPNRDGFWTLTSNVVAFAYRK
jgi:hypothetical protein